MRFLLSSLLCLVFLFVSSVNAADSQQNFYAGRSAPIQFQPKEPADLFCVFHDPSARYFSPSSAIPEEMSIYNVFDAAATAMSLPTMNNDHHSVVTDFVKAKLFDRPRANVFIGLDGVGTRNVQPAVMPHLHQSISQRESASSSSSSSLPFRLRDAEASVLAPSMPTVASIASASPASGHGIVNHMWQGKRGSSVSAYSPSDASSWSHHATFADILSQSFTGKSMTLSFSSHPQVAAAFGVNAVLQQENPNWNNFIIALDEAADAFAAVKESSSSSAFRRSLSSLRSDIFSSASFLHQLSISDARFSFSLDAAANQISIIQGDSTIVFDLNHRADLLFFAELQYIHSLPELLHSSSALSDLATDSYPDALAINVASTDKLALRYGGDSEKFRAALMVLDSALPSLQHRMYGLYPDRAVGELVALGSPADMHLIDETRFLAAVSKFANYPQLEQYLPLFYMPGNQASSSCAAVDAAVTQFGLTAKCIQEGQVHNKYGNVVSHSNAAVTSNAFSVQASASASSVNYTTTFLPTYYPTENEIERFQIVLWVSVTLAFVLIGVIYASAYMSFKKDTMLYSTFNPRWEDKKHR